MSNSEYLGMNIDERISWHQKKLELAEAQLHYHQEQLSKLLAFKERI